MLLLQCLAQQILISVVLNMQCFLEAQESHVPVMRHGVLRLLYVSVDLDMRTYRPNVLVSNNDTHTIFFKRFSAVAACEAGEYHSSGVTTCQQCPDNTVTDVEAAPECQCLTGYFRNNENRVTASGAQSFLTSANEQSTSACTRESPNRILQHPQCLHT